jgi:manganese efflux pump family protein
LEAAGTLLIAVALGCDAFAVGLGVGSRFCSPRQVFRLAFHFGLFQFLMPILGWLLGMNLVGVAREWGPWIASALLMLIGARMLKESFGAQEDRRESDSCVDPTRGFSLVVLSVATSIDALGVGFSLGMISQDLLLPAVLIGVTAGAMTYAAMKVGSRLSQKFGRRMEAVGGIILMVIALKLLF